MHGPHFEPAIEQAFARQRMQHGGAETAGRSLLDGDQHLVVLRKPAQEIHVERLGEARIGDGGGKPEASKLIGRYETFRQPGAEGQ